VQYAAVRAGKILGKLAERGETLPDFRAALSREAMVRQLADERLWQALLTASKADAAIEQAERRYDGTGLSLGIDLEPSLHGPVRQAAQRMGLTMIESRPGMTLAMADMAPVPSPDGVEVFRVEDPALLNEVVEVDAAAFGGDAATTRLFLPDAVLEDPAQRVYAARVDGRLVSVGESTTLDGVIGVFGIATVPAYRRRGLGAAVTALLLADRRGEADLAVLDASDLGLGVYERLGFRSMSTWEVWAREAAP